MCLGVHAEREPEAEALGMSALSPGRQVTSLPGGWDFWRGVAASRSGRWNAGGRGSSSGWDFLPALKCGDAGRIIALKRQPLRLAMEETELSAGMADAGAQNSSQAQVGEVQRCRFSYTLGVFLSDGPFPGDAFFTVQQEMVALLVYVMVGVALSVFFSVPLQGVCGSGKCQGPSLKIKEVFLFVSSKSERTSSGGKCPSCKNPLMDS